VSSDPFARKKSAPAALTGPRIVASPEERTTVVCGCGVVMTLAWRTAEPVRCFGCQRIFAPPPTATAAPLRWRPELAGPRRPERDLRPLVVAMAIAIVLATLLAAGLKILLLK